MSSESLPVTVVAQLVKEALPDGVKCSTAAREIVVKCCNEFTSVLLSEVLEQSKKASGGKRPAKQLQPQHVQAAVEALGFEQYGDELTAALAGFDAAEAPRKKRQKAKKAKGRLGGGKGKLTEAEREELRLEQQRLLAADAEEVL